MSTSIPAEFVEQNDKLFWLFVKTTLLTVVTLGIYRFWAKTRIRKYIWASTSGDGDSFEYTGTGLEKFLGFLIAIVILAIYLGLVQMGLMFFGIFMLSEPDSEAEFIAQFIGSFITVLAVVPLVFFAQYRARRYRMARTRWRGLRFGMESAAWGYVRTAVGHVLLTIVTLGLLLPRQTFHLEKYMVDRTWFGDGKFLQGGRWQDLYPGMKHIGIAICVLILGVLLGAVAQAPGFAGLTWFVGMVWFAIGIMYYRVFAFNYLAAHKTLDGEITFNAAAETSSLVKIYVIGSLALAGFSFVVGGILFSVFAGIAAGTVASVDPNSALLGGLSIGLALFLAVVYIAFFVMLAAITFIMINVKMLAHFVRSVTLINAEHLNRLHQRVADKGADAEGFADALDVGSAF